MADQEITRDATVCSVSGVISGSCDQSAFNFIDLIDINSVLLFFF